MSAVSGSPAQDSVKAVKLTTLMRHTSGHPSVIVGVIDGPVDLDHPDLEHESITLINGPEQKGDAGDIARRHGTLVAGMLNARRDTSVPGLCPRCRLLVYSVFGATFAAERRNVPTATAEQLAAAIRAVRQCGAHIINLSLAVFESDLGSASPLSQALNEAEQQGVIVVAAAGNDGAIGSSSITGHRWVLPVVACNNSGQILGKSNLGRSIGRFGLSAPGFRIPSLSPNGGYGRFTGSSAAVPFVSGALALLWSRFRDATPIQLLRAIRGGRRSRSIAPPFLNAEEAYQLLDQDEGFTRTSTA